MLREGPGIQSDLYRTPQKFQMMRRLPLREDRNGMEDHYISGTQRQACGHHQPLICPSIALCVQVEMLLIAQDQHLCLLRAGLPTEYVYLHGQLQEVNWFKEQYRSWFIGDRVLGDGSLYFCTPVDPLLLALPLLEASRQQA